MNRKIEKWTATVAMWALLAVCAVVWWPGDAQGQIACPSNMNGKHPAVSDSLVNTICTWKAEPGSPHAKIDRFNRVLAAFGVETHSNPMTISEAQGYVDMGWTGRWTPIANTLREIRDYVFPVQVEVIHATEPEQQSQESEYLRLPQQQQDPITIGFTQSKFFGYERDAGVMKVCVELSAAHSEWTSFRINATSDTATEDTDYTEAAGEWRFQPGKTSGCVSEITLIDDDFLEISGIPDSYTNISQCNPGADTATQADDCTGEDFDLVITTVTSGVTISSTMGTAKGIIVDDDKDLLPEAGGAGFKLLTEKAAAAAVQNFEINLSDNAFHTITADIVADANVTTLDANEYELVTSSVTIPIGQKTATGQIRFFDDDVWEETQFLRINVRDRDYTNGNPLRSGGESAPLNALDYLITNDPEDRTPPILIEYSIVEPTPPCADYDARRPHCTPMAEEGEVIKVRAQVRERDRAIGAYSVPFPVHLFVLDHSGGVYFDQANTPNARGGFLTATAVRDETTSPFTYAAEFEIHTKRKPSLAARNKYMTLMPITSGDGRDVKQRYLVTAPMRVNMNDIDVNTPYVTVRAEQPRVTEGADGYATPAYFVFEAHTAVNDEARCRSYGAVGAVQTPCLIEGTERDLTVKFDVLGDGRLFVDDVGEKTITIKARNLAVRHNDPAAQTDVRHTVRIRDNRFLDGDTEGFTVAVKAGTGYTVYGSSAPSLPLHAGSVTVGIVDDEDISALPPLTVSLAPIPPMVEGESADVCITTDRPITEAEVSAYHGRANLSVFLNPQPEYDAGREMFVDTNSHPVPIYFKDTRPATVFHGQQYPEYVSGEQRLGHLLAMTAGKTRHCMSEGQARSSTVDAIARLYARDDGVPTNDRSWGLILQDPGQFTANDDATNEILQLTLGTTERTVTVKNIHSDVDRNTYAAKVKWGRSSGSINENSGPYQPVVVMNKPALDAVSVKVRLTDVSAQLGVDYSWCYSGGEGSTRTIAKEGDTERDKVFVIPIGSRSIVTPVCMIDDETFESNKTATLEIVEIVDPSAGYSLETGETTNTLTIIETRSEPHEVNFATSSGTFPTPQDPNAESVVTVRIARDTDYRSRVSFAIDNNAGLRFPVSRNLSSPLGDVFGGEYRFEYRRNATAAWTPAARTLGNGIHRATSSTKNISLNPDSANGEEYDAFRVYLTALGRAKFTDPNHKITITLSGPHAGEHRTFVISPTRSEMRLIGQNSTPNENARECVVNHPWTDGCDEWQLTRVAVSFELYGPDPQNFPSREEFPELYKPVKVHVWTEEATAHENVDYVGIPRNLNVTKMCEFWPKGSVTHLAKCVIREVTLIQDSHDDGGEQFYIHIAIADDQPEVLKANIPEARARVIIRNDDPLPAAWLARFGRTVAEQALDGIAGRMTAPRTPGMQGTLAGQALSFGPGASGQPTTGSATPGTTPASPEAALAMAGIARGLGAEAYAPAGPVTTTDPFGDPRVGSSLAQSRSMTATEALLGSSFSLTGAQDASGGSLAFWGRAAQNRFDGVERGDGTDIRLDGTVTTGMLGADYARGDWLMGLALTQSASEGEYGALGGDPCPGTDASLCDGALRAGDGEVEASLTAAIPYAALEVSERLKLWGSAGYGSGEVTLKTAMGDRYEADTTWSMAAVGLRGDLLEAPMEGSGPALALTSDALWARTSSEKTRDLAASESDVTRLRLGLEGRYRLALDGEASLTPKLELGARHDGGDAETGFGVELGGGLAWVDPALGLSLDVSGRTLLAHENDDLKDRGMSASLAFDPAPATGRGPSFALRQDFGGQAQGGLGALFAPAPLAERTGAEAVSRWTAEAAYGLPALGGGFTGSPHVGFGLATGTRDWTLGWRLTPEGRTAPDLSFGVKAVRRESDTAPAAHTLGVELRAAW